MLRPKDVTGVAIVDIVVEVGVDVLGDYVGNGPNR